MSIKRSSRIVPRFAKAGFLMVSALAPFAAQGATLDCPASTTLEQLIDCITLQMPQDGSGGFMPPNSVQQGDMQTVVRRMLGGECGFPLPASLANNMAIRTVSDTSNSREYCVLMEVASTVMPGYVDKGWGTFITYAQATREISHHAAHPKYSTKTTGTSGDSFTEREAIRIFKLTDSRSFLMAGARRSANHVSSTCQSKAWMSDVTHDVGNLFFPANQALQAFYGTRDWTAIQWHGKAAATCTNDMFLSNGLNQAPPAGSKVHALHAAIQAVMPAWTVEMPGASTCTLTGTTNVEGRLLNGVAPANVCKTSAKSATQKFIHIEQTTSILGNDLNAAAVAWATALNNTFEPATATPAGE